jgi:asparagine synthase (glutamine-hydrolysing)
MCGIAGIIHSDPYLPVKSETIERMCDAIAHRGPDGFGKYLNGHVGIGMRRLSIIDLETGQQPICNEDETLWIVFNGEIYNYRQLREELKVKGHQFRTTSDTEVIVHLYEEFGENCVQRLRGMFAFAIWDARRKALILARDPVGIKPLYYAIIPEGLIFASEIKALLTQPKVSREIDPVAVAEYFTHLCVPGDLSIFRAVRKLPPAHVLVYESGRVRLHRYWYLRPQPDYGRTNKDWIEQLQVRLQEAVRSHMVADVPVGAFLSGGLDSGAIVALMASASAEPIRTFTVGFSTDAGRFDEREPARAVAERYGTAHQECILAADVVDILPRIVRAFDEPFADSSAIPNWLVCQETARHVKVALSGLGGDELFGGYERYVGLQWGELYQRVPRLARSAIAKIVRDSRDGNGSSYFRDRLRRFVAAGELSKSEQYRSFISAFWNVKDILHPHVCALLNREISQYQRVTSEMATHDSLDLGLFTDLYLYLPDDLLTLTDRISMAHSLEVRVPFLDHELLAFVAHMPAKLKVRAGRKKILFRQAIAPWVPRGHLKRAKQGFSVPMATWLRTSLRPLLTDLVESREWRESPWLKHSAVRNLVDEHLEGRMNHETRLWAIICFQQWERYCLHP